MNDRSIFVKRRLSRDHVVWKPVAERASAVESTRAAAIVRALQISPQAAVHVERARTRI